MTMKRRDSDSHAPDDPEHLIARGLRDTTPEFEVRFDAMRRRLAQEPPRRGLIERLGEAMRGHRALTGAAAAATVALVIIAVRTGAPHEAQALQDGQRWYADMLALDESLRGAVPLADAETREVVSSISLEDIGGGS
jgi:hypothetical protein